MWKDKEYLEGWSVVDGTHLDTKHHSSARCAQRYMSDKNVFKLHCQAIASIAVAQLTQHLSDVNKGWVYIDGAVRYSICSSNRYLGVNTSYQGNNLLSFQEEVTAKKFLVVYRKLIEEAAPILFGTVIHPKREENYQCTNITD